MDYCFFAPQKNDSSLDNLKLSLMWQVEADMSYYICNTSNEPADTMIAIRTISGEGELFSRSGHYLLTADSLIILPMHVILEYRTTNPLWCFYWFQFTGFHCAEQEPAIIPISHVEYAVLGDIVSSLCSQSGNVAQACFKYIFSRWLSAGGEEGNDIATQVARYINASPTEAGLSFESLLNHFGVSERTLRKRFQEAFNISPRQYILDKKLRLASILLKTTDMRLKVIATKAGFQNEYYFSTCFKKHTGLSPTEYRNQK